MDPNSPSLKWTQHQGRWVRRSEVPLRKLHESFPANGGKIYKIVSPSGKAYIGQTQREIRKRMERHRDMKWGNCKLLKRAIAKYGWDSMSLTVLWTGPPKELNSKEIELIAAHGTLAPNGYNSTAGGDANPMSSSAGRQSIKDSWERPETRKKHTEGRKQAWKDPVKRANIMEGRAKSSKVAAAKIANKQNSAEANAKRTATREAKRDARLQGLTEKERKKRLARLNWERERARKKAEAKRTASC